jgi:hypothetical protein
VLGIERRGSAALIHNLAALPPGVESLTVRVHQITSSVTAMLAGFELIESLAQRYATELNRDRTTHRRRSFRSRPSIESIGPESQKPEAIKVARRNLRMVGTWFGQHIPVFFSGLNRPEMFPTIEWLTSHGGPILYEPEHSPHNEFLGWRWALANVSRHETWAHKDLPALQLSMARFREEEERLHILTTLDVAAYPEEKVKFYGGNTMSSILHGCPEVPRGFLIHTSTSEYLKEQLRDINVTRENLKKADHVDVAPIVRCRRSANSSIERWDHLQSIGSFLGSPKPLIGHLERYGKTQKRCRTGWTRLKYVTVRILAY